MIRQYNFFGFGLNKTEQNKENNKNRQLLLGIYRIEFIYQKKLTILYKKRKAA